MLVAFERWINALIYCFLSYKTRSSPEMLSIWQKYRMNRRHILLKEDDRKWQTKGDPNSWGYIQRPLMAYPPLHPTYSVPPGHLYAPWVHPSYQPHGAQMWGHPGFQAWHPPLETWHWKTYPGVIVYRFILSVLLSYICCSIRSQ